MKKVAREWIVIVVLTLLFGAMCAYFGAKAGCRDNQEAKETTIVKEK